MAQTYEILVIINIYLYYGNHKFILCIRFDAHKICIIL